MPYIIKYGPQRYFSTWSLFKLLHIIAKLLYSYTQNIKVKK